MGYDIFGYNSNNRKYIPIEGVNRSNDGVRIERRELASIGESEFKKMMAANAIFSKDDIEWYTKFNRFGFVYPYNDTTNREFLFFTKPDLNIFNVNASKKYSELSLNDSLTNIPIFVDAKNRYKSSLTQLQLSVNGPDNKYNPFMCLLTNTATSRLDLPGISSDTVETSANMYGTTIQYRSHSLKSDNGGDFNISFTDTKYLEVYMVSKLYDEFMRLQRLGTVAPRKKYIINRILSDQFSVYKFIVGGDGETILYFAKATGVFFTDVPRGDFGDPGNDGFKFSLSFHYQFMEDSNPSILSDFNRLTNRVVKTANGDGKQIDFSISQDTMNTFDNSMGIVDNSWAGLPYVARVSSSQDRRAAKTSANGNGDYIYLLKWYK